jgi:prepilin-type N-terminal cleavage/methylation domain-containing protein
MAMRKNGFTLIETVIVLFLITLILGLSSVFFAGFLPTARLEAAGRDLSATIRHARNLARVTMETRTVVIDLDGKTYGIEGSRKKEIPPGTLIRVIDPREGEIPTGTYAIVFHPSGGMRGGTILLSRGKRIIRIELDPITGASLMRE